MGASEKKRSVQIGQIGLTGAEQANRLFGTSIPDSKQGYTTVQLTKWSDGRYLLDLNSFTGPGGPHTDMEYIDVSPTAEALKELHVDKDLQPTNS